jgi:hypothetical protein
VVVASLDRAIRLLRQRSYTRVLSVGSVRPGRASFLCPAIKRSVRSTVVAAAGQGAAARNVSARLRGDLNQIAGLLRIRGALIASIETEWCVIELDAWRRPGKCVLCRGSR